MQSTLRSAAFAVVLSSFVVLGSPMAKAHPITVPQDRTENVVSFSYESSTGEIASERSDSQPTDEDVTFRVVVRETEDAGSGLLGRLRLRLNGDHRTIYNGWFALKVKDAQGKVAFHRSKPANVQLSPKPGMRRASLVYRFDLPAGSYEAVGTFRR